METNFFRIEAHLAELRRAMTPTFPEVELDTVKELVTLADYRDALQAACDLYRSEGKTASVEVVELVKWLADAVGVDPAPLLVELKVAAA